MYYEGRDYRPPRAKAARAPRPGCLIKFIGLILRLALLLALVVGVLYVYPTGIFGGYADVSASDGLPGGYTNILLLGVDVDYNRTSRSDSILILSVGDGKIKLTSLLRDTQVEIPGVGVGKLNSAYSHGGVRLAMQTINQAYGLDIKHYALVDYYAFPPLVDAVGGIDIDVTPEELEQINLNVTQCWKGFQDRGYEITFLESSGENTHLNGLQALAYARIRRIGYDYERTQRQRTVIEAVVNKARANVWNPQMLWDVLSAAIKNLDTNLNYADIASLGVKGLASGGIEQLRLPANGAFTEDGSYLVPDWYKNRELLKEFIYGE